MSTKVAPLGIRLFLEGVEVPAISAQVGVQPDTPATAAIQVVPTDMAMHVLPRTLVHLFFLSDEELTHLEPAPRPAVNGATENNANRFDAPDDRYKLMFVGEIIGFNYGKNPSQRQIIFQCLDLSSYWDACYQWYADYSVGGGGLTDKSQNFVGAGTSLFNSVAGGHKWVIGQILNSPPETAAYKDAKGLLGGLIHLLEGIGGIGGKEGFNGVNDFFTIAQLRYNLLGMLGAIQSDKTSANIYNQKAFSSWLKNGMTSMGSLLSFRDIVNHVNRYVYHHIYPNPSSLYRPGADLNATVTAPTTTLKDSPLGTRALAAIKLAYTALSKARNNIVPGEELGSRTISQVPQTYEFSKEGARWLVVAEEALEKVDTDDKSDAQSAVGEASSIVKDSVRLFNEFGLNDEQATLLNISQGSSNIYRNLANVSDQLQVFLDSAISLLQDNVLGAKKRAGRPGTKTVGTRAIQGTEGARLYNQLFLPECYFVAPPRCNVIFPDQYFQFSFSRNFLREVSRLSMSSGLGNVTGGGRQGSKLFTRNYYAPSIQDTRGKHLFTTTSRGARILLPHEIHSGIVPKYEWANDGHRWAHLAKKAGRDPFFKDGRVGFLQRMANFQFYLHRWSARTMSLTGVFNPNIVLGLPSLVMDRSLPAPEVVRQREQSLGRKWMPVQFLGKIIGYSHSVSQGGGQTSVQFSHCRTHRGLDDEFLSTLSRETYETKTQQYLIQIDVKKILDEANHGQVARATGNDSEQERFDMKGMVFKYMSGKLGEGTLVRGLKSYAGHKVASIDAPSDNDSLIPLSKDQAAEFGLVADGQAVYQRFRTSVAGVTNPDGSDGGVTFIEEYDETSDVLWVPKKITFHMEKTVRTGKKLENVTQSIEQLLTPGWYADIWTNDKISKSVYQELLGVDAITENVSLETAEQDEFFDRTTRQQLVVDATEISGGAADDQFTYSDSSEVAGSSASIQVIPGSVEEAVDALSIIYSMIKQKNGDVHGFISEYTRRPIANIKDMLGTYGLEFDDSGGVLIPEGDDTPVEGFHSRAYGDYNTNVKLPTREGVETQAGDNALKALFPGVPVGTAVQRGRVTNKSYKTAIRPELDPRGRARARVMEYVRELEFSRGLVG